MADRRAIAYGSAVALFALDRITKRLVETNLSAEDTLKIVPGFFDIVYSRNRGVAFGIFNDSAFQWRTLLLVVASLAAVVVVSWILRRPAGLDRCTFWGLTLVLGGALGNVYDRIVSGQVTDFLLFYIGDYQWPAFNLADSAIVVGSGLLLLDLVRPGRKAPHVP
jgi:signal peptidase II